MPAKLATNGGQMAAAGIGTREKNTFCRLLKKASNVCKQIIPILYQLHGGTLDDPIDETIEAFEQLVQQGKIRYYGISSIRPNVIREYVQRSRIVSVMMQYSLLDRRPEQECLDLLKQHQIRSTCPGVAG